MFLSDFKVPFSDVAHGAALLLLPFGLFVLWLPLEILDPDCVSWLLNRDLGQHFTGVVLFRHDSWHFPLMNTALAGYPGSISMVFTDCNPLFALPSKLFSPWLPERFQFTGIWFLCCMYLNFFIIYAILKAYSLERLPAVLGAVLLCLYPPLFGRAVHDTLCAHWIVTALL